MELQEPHGVTAPVVTTLELDPDWYTTCAAVVSAATGVPSLDPASVDSASATSAVASGSAKDGPSIACTVQVTHTELIELATRQVNILLGPIVRGERANFEPVTFCKEYNGKTFPLAVLHQRAPRQTAEQVKTNLARALLEMTPEEQIEYLQNLAG